jgi:UDP-glucose 4-epimerase
VEKITAEHPDIFCTVHCAARIVVPESVREPYAYYRDNVAKSLELFNNLAEVGLPRVVFSSTASLYATVPDFEVREDSPLDPQSPYAHTKQVMEMALTALGEIDAFTITGVNHPRRDGSGIRDYMHVWDLALAHVAAVERFDSVLEQEGATSTVINLGSGSGVTVRELVAAFERVWGAPLPKREAPPRPGDAVGAYANADKAARLLGWRTRSSLDEAIASALECGRRRPAILGYA